MKALEDPKQCLFQELALVKSVPNFFKNDARDLQCRVLHTHLLADKLADDLLNLKNLLSGVLRMFSDNRA